jgi:hypothetical protein
MPTRVVFTGGQDISLEDDFDQVNMQLSRERGAGQFVRSRGDERGRVVVYRDNVLYIEESKDRELLSAQV